MERRDFLKGVTLGTLSMGNPFLIEFTELELGRHLNDIEIYTWLYQNNPDDCVHFLRLDNGEIIKGMQIIDSEKVMTYNYKLEKVIWHTAPLKVKKQIKYITHTIICTPNLDVLRETKLNNTIYLESGDMLKLEYSLKFEGQS